jgi:hypothetical protein
MFPQRMAFSHTQGEKHSSESKSKNYTPELLGNQEKSFHKPQQKAECTPKALLINSLACLAQQVLYQLQQPFVASKQRHNKCC